ncbi:MAG: hypothetical protein JWM74_6193 [Myxococcaceae bacterium]|jgi:hypothetical protein|nr:hypothetical protein [Myxococcaceae bacterium]
MNKLISRLIDKAGVKPETQEKVRSFVADDATKLPLPDKARDLLKKAGVGDLMHANDPKPGTPEDET